MKLFGSTQAERASRLFVGLAALILALSAGFALRPYYENVRRNWFKEESRLKSMQHRIIKSRKARKHWAKYKDKLVSVSPWTREAEEKFERERKKMERYVEEGKRLVGLIKPQQEKAREAYTGMKRARRIKTIPIAVAGLFGLWVLGSLAFFVRGASPPMRTYLLLWLGFGGLILVVIPVGVAAGWAKGVVFWAPVGIAGLVLGVFLRIKLKRFKELEARQDAVPMDTIRRALWAAAPCLSILGLAGAWAWAGYSFEWSDYAFAGWGAFFALALALAGRRTAGRAAWLFGPRRAALDTRALRVLKAVFSPVGSCYYALAISPIIPFFIVMPLVLSVTSFVFPHIPALHPGGRSVYAALGLSLALGGGFVWLMGWRKLLLRGAGFELGDEAVYRFRGLSFRYRTHVPVKKDLKWIPRFFAHLLGAALVSVASMWVAHRIWHGRVDDMRAALEEKGHAVRMRDLLRAELPAGNAHPELPKVLKKLDDGSFLDDDHPGLAAGRWSSVALSKEKRSLEKHWEFLDGTLLPELEKYSYMQSVTAEQVERNPVGLPYLDLGSWSRSNKLLGLAAGVRAAEGRPERAWKYVSAQLKQAELVGSDAMLFSKLFSASMSAYVGRSIINVMLNDPSARLPRDIELAAARFLSKPLVLGGMRMELAFRLELVEWIETQGPEALEGTEFGGYLGWGLTKMGLFDLSVLRDIPVFLRSPSMDTRRAIDWRAQRRRNEAAQAELEALPAWPYIMLKGIFAGSTLGKFRLRETEGRAWLRLALLCSALNEYRRSNGTYPEGLDVLTPRFATADLLADPFHDADWIYVREPDGKGYTLSSRGPYGTGMDSKGKKLAFTQRF